VHEVDVAAFTTPVSARRSAIHVHYARNTRAGCVRESSPELKERMENIFPQKEYIPTRPQQEHKPCTKFRKRYIIVCQPYVKRPP
jgi:hypothetical protein